MKQKSISKEDNPGIYFKSHKTKKLFPSTPNSKWNIFKTTFWLLQIKSALSIDRNWHVLQKSAGLRPSAVVHQSSLNVSQIKTWVIVRMMPFICLNKAVGVQIFVFCLITNPSPVWITLPTQWPLRIPESGYFNFSGTYSVFLDPPSDAFYTCYGFTVVGGSSLSVSMSGIAGEKPHMSANLRKMGNSIPLQAPVLSTVRPVWETNRTRENGKSGQTPVSRGVIYHVVVFLLPIC